MTTVRFVIVAWSRRRQRHVGTERGGRAARAILKVGSGAGRQDQSHGGVVGVRRAGCRFGGGREGVQGRDGVGGQRVQGSVAEAASSRGIDGHHRVVGL